MDGTKTNTDRFAQQAERKRSHYAKRSPSWWAKQYPSSCWPDYWLKITKRTGPK